MQTSANQRGFTLIEVMVSGFASSIMVLALFAVYVQSHRLSEAVETQLSLNQEARLMMELLANGMTSTVSPDNDPFLYSGFHSHIPETTLAWLGDTNHQMMVGSKPSTNIQTTITCEGAGIPFTECVGTEDITVSGYLDMINPGPADNPAAILVAAQDPCERVRVSYVQLRLLDPFRAANPRNTPLEYSENYSTIYHIGVDEQFYGPSALVPANPINSCPP